MNLDQALALLRRIDLGAGDHAIFGSGPLLVRDIIPEVGDIDILARDRAWDRALGLGDLVVLPVHDVEVVSLHGGLITIGKSWWEKIVLETWGNLHSGHLLTPQNTMKVRVMEKKWK